jgi:hypothetical protein
MPPVVAAILVVLSIVLAYIGLTQFDVCGGGYTMLYLAAADAAGASALAVLGRIRSAGIAALGFVAFLILGAILLSRAACPI